MGVSSWYHTSTSMTVSVHTTSRFLWLRAIVGLGVVLLSWWLWTVLKIDPAQLTSEHIRTFVLSFGFWAPAMYLIVYGQPLIPLPASIMIAGAGIIFGPLWGTVLAIFAATIRALGQFGLAKWCGRAFIERFLKGRLGRLDAHIGANGFRTVLLIRLIPNVPYDMQNLTLGCSGVAWAPFLLGTVLGIIPSSLLFIYFGHFLADPKQWWKLFAIAGLGILGVLIQRRYRARPLVSKRAGA